MSPDFSEPAASVGVEYKTCFLSGLSPLALIFDAYCGGDPFLIGISRVSRRESRGTGHSLEPVSLVSSGAA